MKKYALILLLTSFSILILWLFNKDQRGKEYTVETTVKSFSIHSWKSKPVSKISGAYLIALDITPAPFPPESFDIYKYAKQGGTVHIVLTDSTPNYRFSIIGFRDDYMLVKLQTKNEVIEFMGKFNYPYELYSKYL